MSEEKKCLIEDHERHEKYADYLWRFSLIITPILLALIIALICFSCQFIPDMSKSIETIETQEAINVIVDKACLQKETDVSVRVDIQNKDQPTK